MEELKKYNVRGQFVVDVAIEVEAESEDEAIEIFNSLGSIEYCNTTVGVNDYDIDGEVDLYANYIEFIGCEEI